MSMPASSSPNRYACARAEGDPAGAVLRRLENDRLRAMLAELDTLLAQVEVNQMRESQLSARTAQIVCDRLAIVDAGLAMHPAQRARMVVPVESQLRLCSTATEMIFTAQECLLDLLSPQRRGLPADVDEEGAATFAMAV